MLQSLSIILLILLGCGLIACFIFELAALTIWLSTYWVFKNISKIIYWLSYLIFMIILFIVLLVEIYMLINYLLV